MSLSTLQVLCSKDYSEIASEEADARCDRYRWFAAETQNFALTFARKAQKNNDAARVATLEARLSASIKDCASLRSENECLREELTDRDAARRREAALEDELEELRLRVVRAESEAENALRELTTVRSTMTSSLSSEVDRLVNIHMRTLKEDALAAANARRTELAAAHELLRKVVAERDGLKRYIEDAMQCRARAVRELLHIQSCKAPSDIVYYS